MYFDETVFNEWSIAKAIDSYSIMYSESSVMSRKIKTDLEVICKNPNILKAAKEKAQHLLNKWKENKPKSKQSAPSTSASAPSPSTSVVNNMVKKATNSSITFNSNVQDAPPARKKRNIDDSTSDEIDALFNSVQEYDHEEEECDPVYLRDPPSQDLPAPSTYYTVNGNINVSEKFHSFQRQSKAIMESQGFIIETSCFEILSLSSILLLKPRQYSSILRGHFSSSELKMIENDYKKSLLGEKDVCNMDLLGSMETIINKLLEDSNRENAIKCLSALSAKDAAQTKVVRMLINLILTLPLYQVNSESGEINLCVQYLHPILSHLFNDDDQELLLQWPNKLIMDAGTKRPDAVVYQMDQDSYCFPVAFGEAKLKSATNLLLVKDLLRIAMFSKDAIDKNNLSSILSFQAVGNRVSFYIMQLKNDGLYMMLELCSVDLPNSVADLPRFSLIVNDLLMVVKAAGLCRQITKSGNQHRRPSYYSPQYRSFLVKKNQALNPPRLTLKF